LLRQVTTTLGSEPAAGKIGDFPAVPRLTGRRDPRAPHREKKNNSGGMEGSDPASAPINHRDRSRASAAAHNETITDGLSIASAAKGILRTRRNQRAKFRRSEPNRPSVRLAVRRTRKASNLADTSLPTDRRSVGAHAQRNERRVQSMCIHAPAPHLHESGCVD